MTTSVEFMVEASETSLVVDTARAAAGDTVERITVAPVDGTPRFKVIIDQDACCRALHAYFGLA